MDDCIHVELQTTRMGRLHYEVQLPNPLHLLNGFVEVTLHGFMTLNWLGRSSYSHCWEASRKNHHLESSLLLGNQLFIWNPTIVFLGPAFSMHQDFFVNTFSSMFQNFLKAKQMI